MARTSATLPGGARVSDYLSVNVIAAIYPRDAVRAVLVSSGRDSRRRRQLPAEVMVYFVIAMALFRTVAMREVLRCLLDGLRWASADEPLRVSGKSLISRARARLGEEPITALVTDCVAPLAAPETPGALLPGLAPRCL